MHDVEAARVGREHVTPVVVDPDLSLCEHRRKPVAPDRLGVVGHGSVVALELAVRRVGRDVVVLLALDVLHVERPRIGERATDRLAKRAEHGVGVEHVGEGLGLGHERQQLLRAETRVRRWRSSQRCGCEMWTILRPEKPVWTCSSVHAASGACSDVRGVACERVQSGECARRAQIGAALMESVCSVGCCLAVDV
eukprot:364976-Chlamydomonas_euryale.AAC.14